MKTIIIISPCINSRHKNLFFESEFHFKGFCSGHQLKRLLIHSNEEYMIGEEYILYVQVEKIVAKTLYGIALKAKPLNSLRVVL